MKKISFFLFITLIILSALSNTSLAQNNNKSKTTLTTQYIDNATFDKLQEALRVIVANDSSKPVLTLNVYSYVNKTLSFTDTTNKTMVRDTVSRKWSNTTNSLGVIYSKWIKFTVTAIDDTILFSSDPTFPSNKSTTLYPGESFTSEKRDVYYFLNYYYKVKGWGVATVRWIIEGV